jgi:hypothetical protein
MPTEAGPIVGSHLWHCGSSGRRHFGARQRTVRRDGRHFRTLRRAVAQRCRVSSERALGFGFLSQLDSGPAWALNESGHRTRPGAVSGLCSGRNEGASSRRKGRSPGRISASLQSFVGGHRDLPTGGHRRVGCRRRPPRRAVRGLRSTRPRDRRRKGSRCAGRSARLGHGPRLPCSSRSPNRRSSFWLTQWFSRRRRRASVPSCSWTPRWQGRAVGRRSLPASGCVGAVCSQMARPSFSPSQRADSTGDQLATIGWHRARCCCALACSCYCDGTCVSGSDTGVERSGGRSSAPAVVERRPRSGPNDCVVAGRGVGGGGKATDRRHPQLPRPYRWGARCVRRGTSSHWARRVLLCGFERHARRRARPRAVRVPALWKSAVCVVQRLPACHRRSTRRRGLLHAVSAGSAVDTGDPRSGRALSQDARLVVVPARLACVSS